MKLTERNIIKALYRLYFQGSLVMINNIQMYGSFEADFLRVTPTGYTAEFEVKLTVADFKKDAKKNIGGMPKYEYMQLGLGANSFCYVMPQNVVDKVTIPKWAGLIIVKYDKLPKYGKDYGKIIGYKDYVITTKVKNHKKLHRIKITEKQLAQIYRSLHWKYWLQFK